MALNGDDVNINLHREDNPFLEIYELARMIGDMPQFNDALKLATDKVPKGTPPAHWISTFVMGLFDPAFVVVGGPGTRTTADGYTLPMAVGLVISSNTNMGLSDLAMILDKHSKELKNAVDDSIEEAFQ